jgi:hypothetical protein
LYRQPYQIMYGTRHGLGWQQPKNERPCYVLLRANAMGGVKVLERYPLTENGWARAWAALIKLDRAAAVATRITLEARAALAAADAAERERPTEVYEAFVQAGPRLRLSAHSAFRFFLMSARCTRSDFTIPPPRRTPPACWARSPGLRRWSLTARRRRAPARSVLADWPAGMATKTKACAMTISTGGNRAEPGMKPQRPHVHHRRPTVSLEEGRLI